MKQEELFEKYGAETEKIWYYLGTDDSLKEKFLQFAKDLGFRWMDGSEIRPQEDGCATVMGVNREGKMGQVSLYLWSQLSRFGSRKAIKRVEFETGRWMDEKEYAKTSYVLVQQ